MRWLGVGLLPLLLAAGCSDTTQVVPLLSAAGVPVTEPTTQPLEVVTRSTAVPDPLPLSGSDVAYADVEAGLGHAIASAAVPWATAHRDDPAGKSGWQLFVEVTTVGAEYERGRVIFSVDVRATLRARAGNVYLAQTQASCRQGGIVRANLGAPIIYRCMTEIGHNLAGWLDGVDLHAAPVPTSN